MVHQRPADTPGDEENESKAQIYTAALFRSFAELMGVGDAAESSLILRSTSFTLTVLSDACNRKQDTFVTSLGTASYLSKIKFVISPLTEFLKSLLDNLHKQKLIKSFYCMFDHLFPSG
jgi:hypothetical protein